jgi:hypothetical protein
VTNLFINWANVAVKKSWWASFGFENKNISRIASYNDIKWGIFNKNKFLGGPAGSLKTLKGKKCPQALGWAAMP